MDGPASDAPRQVMRALIAHPGSAIGVLASAGRHPGLEWLVNGAPPAMWIDLARAVLFELSAGSALLHERRPDDEQEPIEIRRADQ